MFYKEAIPTQAKAKVPPGIHTHLGKPLGWGVAQSEPLDESYLEKNKIEGFI